jgi:hypothetical protein
MIQSISLLARTGTVVGVLSLVYIAPLVFASTQTSDQVAHTNKITMNGLSEHTLDVATVNFLKAIEEATVFYDSQNFSMHEELVVRVRLRDVFEVYFATLIPLESKYGLEVTERSREVIQSSIDEFMESDSQRERSSDIADDLDAYSTIMTESLIHTAVSV